MALTTESASIIRDSRAAGETRETLAARLGCTVRYLIRHERRIGLPPRARCNLGFTATQTAVIRDKYITWHSVNAILNAVNCLPGATINKSQLHHKIRSMELRRPPKESAMTTFTTPRNFTMTKRDAGKTPTKRSKPNATPQPDRPVAVPLRELIRLAGEYGVPLSDRTNVEKVNRHVRATGHPGFTIAAHALPGRVARQ
jgi:hypothetical protein